MSQLAQELAAGMQAHIIWLQRDAAYLYARAADARERGGEFVACLIQQNAAHSARMARIALGIESWT
jgi:hypothetical protein